MAEDWAIDVKKYVPDADEKVIAAIVRHCGTALQKRDSALVSFTAVKETDRVRESFLKKKLALTDPDSVLDAAIARVGDRMKQDRTRNRVTVYYLLAEAFEKLGLFGGATALAPVAATIAAPVVAAFDPAAAVAASASLAVSTAPAAQPDTRGKSRGFSFGGFAFGSFGLLAVLIAAAVIGTLIGIRANRTHVQTPSPAIEVPATPSEAAPVPAVSATPTGAGVIASEVAGKPQVSIYFDPAKTEISPDFATVTAPVKAWIDNHPGARVAVSGFNDPSGNAALNAELSKNRAKSVAAALAGLGVPTSSVDLVKPAETTDADTTQANARRVDIVVTDAK